MSDSSPGPSSAVPLVPERKKRNLDLCIICQHVKDSQGNRKLFETSDGQKTIRKTSDILQDYLWIDLSNEDLKNIKYHLKTCYAHYRRKGERHIGKQLACKRSPEPSFDTPLSSPESRKKRAKTSAVSDPRDKPCIICNQIKCQGDSQRFRIRAEIPAKNCLKVIAFYKDDVYNRCIVLKTVKDVYAAYTMRHGNCLNKYLKQFQRDVDVLMNFEEVVDTLQLSEHGYVISDVRDLLNEKLGDSASWEPPLMIGNCLSESVYFQTIAERRRERKEDKDYASGRIWPSVNSICEFDIDLCFSFNAPEAKIERSLISVKRE